MTGPRLPDGFAVQVDRRVKVLGEGSALLGGSPTRLLRLAPAAQTMLNGGRLEVHDAVSAQLARTLLDATVAHPRPASGPSHRDVTVVIPVRDNISGLLRLVGTLRGMRVVVVDDGSADASAAERLRRHALRHPGAAPRPQQGAGGGAQHRAGGVHHRLRGLPRLRRGAAARVARGAARPFLRPRRRAGRTADRRAAASRQPGGPLRGGALVAGPGSARGAGGALRHGVLRPQRRHHLPALRAQGTRRLRRDAQVRRGRRPVLAVHRGGRPAALRAHRAGRSRPPHAECEIGSRASLSTANRRRRCRSAIRARPRRW